MKLKWKGAQPHKPTFEETGCSYEQFEEQLPSFFRSFDLGAVVAGKVVEFIHKGALVDIGSKSIAWMPEFEYSLPRANVLSPIISLDNEVEVKIITREDRDGQLTVSIRRLQIDRAWEKVLKIKEEDATVDFVIVSVNKGGACIEIDGLRGFLPGSHFVSGHPKEEHTGQTFPCKIMTVERESGKLVVSNKLAAAEDKLKMFKKGILVQGTVCGVKPYGVFVDVMGVSTLLHISQISNAKVENLESLFTLGQAVTAVVQDVDSDKNRITLSTKMLELSSGDIIKDMQGVFDNAAENLKIWEEKQSQIAESTIGAPEESVGPSLQHLEDELAHV